MSSLKVNELFVIKLWWFGRLVKEGDLVEELESYGKANLIKFCFNNNILKCKSNKWMDDVLKIRKSVFKVFCLNREKETSCQEKACVILVIILYCCYVRNALSLIS